MSEFRSLQQTPWGEAQGLDSGLHTAVIVCIALYCAQTPVVPLVQSVLAGKGVTDYQFLICAFLTYFLWPAHFLFNLLLVLNLLWLFPLSSLTKALETTAKHTSKAAEVRSAIPKLAPYVSDLLPFYAVMFTKRETLLENITPLSDSLPMLFAHREYVLPHFEQMMLQIDLLLPDFDLLISNLPKLAPKLDLIMPKMEILLPHLSSVMPLWDSLEPQLEVLLEEVDNFGDSLGVLIKDMDRMTPVLDLLPLAHESRLFQHQKVVSALPYLTKLLPKKDATISRYLLQKLAQNVSNLHISAKHFYLKEENKLIQDKISSYDQKSIKTTY